MTQRGFTLIELMVTVVIIAILATIAYPAYQQYTMRARRGEAQSLMMEQAQAQERLMTSTGNFASQTLNSPVGSADSDRFYLITVTASSGSYTIQAAPESRQDDPTCGTLTLSAIGQRGITGTGQVSDCWKS